MSNRFDYADYAPLYLQKYVCRRYYTMEDFYIGMKKNNAFGPLSPSHDKWTLKDLGQRMYGPSFNYPDGDSTSLYSAEVNKLFNDYIFPKYWDCFIAYSDTLDVENAVAMSQDEFIELFEMFAAKLVGWVRDTLPAYRKEIQLYSEIENNLLDEIGSTSETKFNDTPQIAGVSNTDNYATNITTSKTSTEVATKIRRLAEVRENIRNVYEAWSKEFRVFIRY